MENKRGLAAAVFITLVFFGITFSTLDVGLPSKDKASLLFTNEAQHRAKVPILIALREKIYQQITKDDAIVRIAGFDPMSPEELALHQSRAFLLQTVYTDESSPVRALQNINPKRFKFDPHFYQYGAMYLYSIGGAIQLCTFANFFPNPKNVEAFLLNPEYTKRLWMAPRVLSAIFVGMAGLVLFFLIREKMGVAWGIVACVMTAGAPTLFIECHFLKPYAQSVLFNCLVFYFLNKGVLSGNILPIYFAGASAALSVGFLPANGIFLPVIAAVGWYFLVRKMEGLMAFLKFTGFLVLAFFVFSPWWVLNYSSVMKEFSVTHQQLGGDAREISSPLRWLKYWIVGLPLGTNVLMYVAALIGIVLGFVRKDFFVIAAVAPLFLATPHIAARFSAPESGFFAHYASPLYPVLVISAVYALACLHKKHALLAIVYTGLMLVFGLVQLAYYTVGFKQFDKVLVQTGAWMNENIPVGAAVGSLRISPSGAPPFRFLDYNLYGFAANGDLETPVKPEKQTIFSVSPEFYLSNGLEEFLGAPEFVSHYRELVRFQVATPFDGIVKNHLFPQMSRPFVLYKRN